MFLDVVLFWHGIFEVKVDLEVASGWMVYVPVEA